MSYRVYCNDCGHDLEGVNKGYVGKFMSRHWQAWGHDAGFERIDDRNCDEAGGDRGG